MTGGAPLLSSDANRLRSNGPVVRFNARLTSTSRLAMVWSSSLAVSMKRATQLFAAGVGFDPCDHVAPV